MNDDLEASRLRRTLRSLCTINPATRSYELSFLRWMLLWAAGFLVSQYTMRNEIITGGLIIWVLPTVTVIFSFVAFQRYYRFLMVADELTRKILLDGISFAFGLTIIVFTCLFTFEPLGAPQPEGNDVISMMVLAWPLGQFWGHWKYQ